MKGAKKAEKALTREKESVAGSSSRDKQPPKPPAQQWLKEEEVEKGSSSKAVSNREKEGAIRSLLDADIGTSKDKKPEKSTKQESVQGSSKYER